MKTIHKLTIIAAVIAGACSMFCATSSAQILISLPTPQDDQMVRGLMLDRPEFKPLANESQTIIRTRLQPLKLDQVAKIFGTRLETETSPPPFLTKYPTNLVLPSFSDLITAISGISGGRSSNPAYNKFHADLHAVSDIGYIEFFYQNNGESLQTATVFFRTDDKFVPLKSTNDLPKRLEWDKAKFEAMKKWLDEHLPGK